MKASLVITVCAWVCMAVSLLATIVAFNVTDAHTAMPFFYVCVVTVITACVTVAVSATHY